MLEVGKYARFELERRFLLDRLPDGVGEDHLSIYLSPREYELMGVLPGRELRKRRSHLGPYSIDVFEGELEGLILAEMTFESDTEMRAHPIPDFAVREVSDDVRYAGGALAAEGLPE